MFINNIESGLDKLFQFCRITLQQRLCKPVAKDIRACNSQTGEGEGSGNSARPQNLEPSHAVKIVRQLLTFVKGTRAKLFRRCALSPTNRKVFFQFQCGPVVRERKIYSSNFGLDLIALGQSPAVLHNPHVEQF